MSSSLTMMSACTAALLLLLAHTAAAASIFDLLGSSVSSLVSTQEEAPYTVIREEERYEERLYPARTWVCKRHNGSLTASAQQAAFLALFDYLEGENSQNLTMEMTIPVSVEAPGSPTVREFEACFYIGAAQQENTPTPTAAELFLKQRPEMVIFTRRFGGYADTEEEWRTATEGLATVLSAAGELTLQDKYFWNAFDSPIRFWSRRNEVWIQKKP